MDAPPLKGLRIAVISDLHAGSPYVDTKKLDQVVALTNAARPDMVLLAGDYVVSRNAGMAIETVAAHLKPLRARMGVFAVIGNHDRWYDAPRVTRALQAAGFTVLENSNRRILGPHGPITVVGIGDFKTHAADPASALRGVGANTRALCFAHSPDIFPRLPRLCALTVAGHTHGGQVALPILGRPIVPSRYGQLYAAGLVHEDGKSLFVSTGIGTSIIPVRLGVPPEISALDIH